MHRLGLDIGTKHIVLAHRDGQKIKYKYEINAYMSFPRVDDSFLEQLLIKQGVPYVVRGNKEIIAIGDKAEQLAYTMNKTLKRPMASGGLNKLDDDAQEIVAIIVKSLIGELDDNSIIYYCTTAQPINSENVNIEFHKKIIKLIVQNYVSSGTNVSVHHLNEARALIIEEQGCAIGISWGAGTITVHAGIFGVPIFEFSIVGAGDEIDIESAKRFGYDPLRPEVESRETPTTICRRKQQLDFNKIGDSKVDQTIYLMYEILIEKVIDQIIRGFKLNKDKYKFDKPIPIINAGGTCMPNGFLELFEKKLRDKTGEINIPIGKISKANEPLFGVARGLLLAAEMHKDENNNSVKGTRS